MCVCVYVRTVRVCLGTGDGLIVCFVLRIGSDIGVGMRLGVGVGIGMCSGR